MNGTYFSINETAKITGLSAYWIRQQVKAGKIPYVRCGMKYCVHLPKTMELLSNESEKNAKGAEVKAND